MLEAALDYAGRGWPVFPCLAGRKEPLTAHGKDDATTDAATIRAWWTRWPSANVAIRTGAPAADVLDIDVRENGNGWPSFNRLVRAGMLAGAIRLVRTRSGGLHVYYLGTGQGCRSLKGLFVDFKATGGYVLAPPSLVAGKAYELIEQRQGEGRPLDFSRVEAILVPPKPKPRGRARSTGASALAQWLEGQREGNRNKALFWAACRAAEADCTDADFDDLIRAAVATGQTPLEAEKTVASARRKIGASA
jgi:Bifunctional DNA primase/polymerase, N-terminal